MIFLFDLVYKVLRFFVLLQIIKYLYINYNNWAHMNELFWYLSLLLLDLWFTKNAVYITENKIEENEED